MDSESEDSKRMESEPEDQTSSEETTLDFEKEPLGDQAKFTDEDKTGSNACETAEMDQTATHSTYGNSEEVNEDEPHRNAYPSGGRKRTGDQVIETSCMICYAPCEQNPKVRRQNPGFNASSSTGTGKNEGDKPSAVVNEEGDILDLDGAMNQNHVDSQMGVMFVLRRLLLFPKSLCEELLETYGTPSSWNAAFCTFCASTIEEAQEIAEKISNYQMKFKCLQERFKDEILISAQEQVVPMDMDTSAVVEDIRQRFVQRNGDGQVDSETVYQPWTSRSPSPQTELNQNPRIETTVGSYPDDEIPDQIEPDLSLVKVQAPDWDDEEEQETAEPFPAWEDLPDPGSVCQVVVKSLKDEFEGSASSSQNARYPTRNRSLRSSQPIINKIQRSSVFKAKSSERASGLAKKKLKGNTNKFKCPLCIGRFSSVQLMNSHYASKHLDKVALKSTGGRAKKRKVSRRRSSSSEREFESGDEKNLERRPGRGERKYQFKCPDCPQHFPSEYFRDAHHRRRHLNIRLCFVCDRCGKAYDRNQSLEVHKKNCDGDGTFVYPDAKLQETEKFKCPKCPRHYPSEIAKEAHLKRFHLGIKLPFECKAEGCEKAYKTKRQLTEHEKRCTAGDNGEEISADGNYFGLDEPEPEPTQNEFENDNNEDGSGKDEQKPSPPRISKSKFKKGEYKCPVSSCNKMFRVREVRDGHVKKVHDGNTKAFTCEVCGKGFTKFHVLKAHEPIHNKAGNPFKCEPCGKEFSSKISLKTHNNLVHEKIDLLKCEQCGAEFKSTSGLVRHQRGVHEKRRNFICDLCGDRFPRSSMLKFHNHSKHWKELNLEPYKCDKCDPVRYFAQPYHKFQHDKILHAKAFTHFCSICNQGFINQSSLDRHQFVHTGEKPCKCEVCGKGLSRPADLHRHMRLHTGERPYCCEHCGKQFSDGSKLGKHRRKHEPPKFECDICFKKFFTSTNVKNHRKIHEPGHQTSRIARVPREKQTRFRPPKVDDGSSTSNVSSSYQDCPVPSTSNQQSGHFQNPNQSSYVANGTIPIPTQQHLPTPQAAHSNRIESQSQANPSRSGHAPAFGNNSATDFPGRQYYDPIAHWLNIS